jgi:hypothetical protein
VEQITEEHHQASITIDMKMNGKSIQWIERSREAQGVSVFYR